MNVNYLTITEDEQLAGSIVLRRGVMFAAGSNELLF